MEERIVICEKHDTLECFLVASKGWSCKHIMPHRYDHECCDDSVCTFIKNTKLSGCICTSTKE